MEREPGRVRCGAALAATAYGWLALDHGSVAAVVAANTVLGLGTGLAVAAITNLVVHSVGERRTSLFAATTAVSRFTGSAVVRLTLVWAVLDLVISSKTNASASPSSIANT